MAAAPAPRNIDITLPTTGMRLAAQSFGNPEHPVKVLALHGWMDNSASFESIGPTLARRGSHVVALDYAGHGWSEHRPRGQRFCTVLEYVSDAIEAADVLEWRQFVVVGHSLGAGVASIMAASFPDRVLACIMIEGLGMLSRPSGDAHRHLRSAFDRSKLTASRSPRVHESLAAAVARRVSTASAFPGEQFISEAGARALVLRGAVPAGAAASAADLTPSQRASLSAGPVEFCHDRRIADPSPLYLTEEQVHSYLNAIQCPCLYVRGRQGWPMSKTAIDFRAGAVGGELQQVLLPGSHHLHLDPDSAPAVAENIVRWVCSKLAVVGRRAAKGAEGESKL